MFNGTLVAMLGAYSTGQARDALLTAMGLFMTAAGVCLFLWGVVTRG